MAAAQSAKPVFSSRWNYRPEGPYRRQILVCAVRGVEPDRALEGPIIGARYAPLTIRHGSCAIALIVSGFSYVHIAQVYTKNEGK
jgi:hypothetical protein